MSPEEEKTSASRQELIDILFQIAGNEEETIEEGEIVATDDVEDGELSESKGSDSDDVEELNLRLTALRSLPAVEKQTKQRKMSKKKSRRRRANDDIDLRPSAKPRSSNRYEDREYLLDKDYRQPSVFDMLLSLISPDRKSNNHNRKLYDNYDIQHMDIVDDSPPTMSMVPPPPLPPNHLPFFDPLPPLPPPPPSIFNLMPSQNPFPVTHWPRPNFVPQTTDLWQNSFPTHTDIDLRHQPISVVNESISPSMKKSPIKRKRPKKSARKHRQEPIPVITINNDQVKQQDEDDEEAERLLREELLRTMTNKRKVKITSEPERVVTIVPVKTVDEKTQYTVDQRYKLVKANPVRPTQPIIQTRNRIVRAPETEAEIPQSTPIIINFDEGTTDDEEQMEKPSTKSNDLVTDEEHQAIKRLQQQQEEAIRNSNASEVTTKKPPAPPTVEVNEEALPSTDELGAILEKRRMLLNERAKYGTIQENMKKKKLENGLLARDIERLEEQLRNKKAQINNNNALLQHWQKTAMAIAQNIKEREETILQSAVFKSVKPNSQSIAKPLPVTVQFDWSNLMKSFDSHNKKILLSTLICPWSIVEQLSSYQLWYKTISTRVPETNSTADENFLLRTRGFSMENEELHWKASLQAYLIDINQVFCPYELQGSCKAQNCIYQHQHQITQRIEQYLSKRSGSPKDRYKLLANVEKIASIPSFDLDWSLLERKINEKQYQRCRAKLDRYLSINQEDFRYFCAPPADADETSSINPILLSVSNQLDSDDFSLERAVAELVEGLESQRTNAQLWSLYLEFSSWNMSDAEFYPLCVAALKNAQSYELFWTIFDLCSNHFDDFSSIYLSYLQSNPSDISNLSSAICELAMFDGYLTEDFDKLAEKLQNYLSNRSLNAEHRLYLILVLLYTFAFGSFPWTLCPQLDDERNLSFEPFLCPWYFQSSYAHSFTEIDQFFEQWIRSDEQFSEVQWPLYLNKIHYLNASKRSDQCKIYIQSLIEQCSTWTQLWMEYFLNPNVSIDEIPQILTRATSQTGVHYEYLYALSSRMNIESLLENSSIPNGTSRDRCFFDLCHWLLANPLNELTLDQILQRNVKQSRDLIMFNLLFYFNRMSLTMQERFARKFVDCLCSSYENIERSFLVYSLFSLMPINRMFDLVLDCYEQNEWILRPFTCRLLEIDRNRLVWIRFDAFSKQMLINSQQQDIYLTILQRLMIASNEEKSKIIRLCRLFEKHYVNGVFISRPFRQQIFQSISSTD